MSRSTRRAFLGTLGAAGTAAVVLPELGTNSIQVGADLSAAAPAAGGGQAVAGSYDLLIKGGRVIDASQKLSAVRDVAIAGGKIAAVAENIPAARAKEVFDARGRIVTPGLINQHAHVYKWVYAIAVDPDAVSFPAGVTTIIDAGSAGSGTFQGLRKWVMEPSPARIYAMLNISSVGNFGNELYMSMGVINPRAAINTINQNKDRIVGIKVRINGKHDELAHDLEVLKRAREASDATGLPIMMHWTNERDLLNLLKKGDILTHPFNIPNGNQDNLFGGQPGPVLPQILELKDRGIWTEGQAVNSHHLWVNSEKAFEQGWRPDVISTDMGALNKETPNGLLLTYTMTQYLHLGLTIEEVIERVTLRPTQIFKLPEKVGTLEVGTVGDVTVIDLQEGNFELIDQQNNKRTAKRKIVPVATVHGGTLTRVDPAVHTNSYAGTKV